MSKILVQTGFGYYKDQQGHVTDKAQLPAGQHDLQNGLIYVEVNSRAELDAIAVYQDPAELEAQQNEIKIQAEMRSTAIAELIATGDLPAGYK